MKVLLLSPHTDDVELGAGGTVTKLIEQGNEVLWVVFSTAEDSVPSDMPKDVLKKEFVEVMKKMNLSKENYSILNFRVRRFHEKRQEILEELIKIRKEFNPDLVIAPSLNDFHQDHNVIAKEALRGFNKQANIIGYEMPWNNTSFFPNLFVTISEKHLNKKMEILDLYKSQKSLERKYFSRDIITSMANIRGIQCNSKFAEAFEVIRWRL